MHKVAVYGTLKTGQANHFYLEGLSPLVEETISGWDMFAVYGGGFPAIVEGEGSILIQVFEVDDATFRSLDGLEGYPSFYNRKKVSTSVGEAWIYFWDEVGGGNLEDLSNIKVFEDGSKSFGER